MWSPIGGGGKRVNFECSERHFDRELSSPRQKNQHRYDRQCRVERRGVQLEPGIVFVFSLYGNQPIAE